MNKHLPHDLEQMQILPLEAKIRMSTRRIDSWFVHWDGNVYVSFSGGKDSTVLADLVARYCQRYGYVLYLVFVNTGWNILKFKSSLRPLRNGCGTHTKLKCILKDCGLIFGLMKS